MLVYISLPLADVDAGCRENMTHTSLGAAASPRRDSTAVVPAPDVSRLTTPAPVVPAPAPSGRLRRIRERTRMAQPGYSASLQTRRPIRLGFCLRQFGRVNLLTLPECRQYRFSVLVSAESRNQRGLIRLTQLLV